MKIVDIIIISIIALWVIGSITYIFRSHKKGHGCCGCCSGNCEKCYKSCNNKMVNK